MSRIVSEIVQASVNIIMLAPVTLCSSRRNEQHCLCCQTLICNFDNCTFMYFFTAASQHSSVWCPLLQAELWAQCLQSSQIVEMTCLKSESCWNEEAESGRSVGAGGEWWWGGLVCCQGMRRLVVGLFVFTTSRDHLAETHL